MSKFRPAAGLQLDVDAGGSIASCASAYSIEGASYAREDLPDILSHRIEFLEMFKNMSHSLVDLEFVPGKRFHA